jgi:ZIP family zinc transporter
MSLFLAAQALFWGLVSGSALIIGCLVGLRARLGRRMVAGVMAFGSGLLISVIAFNLMDEAFSHAGLAPAVVGFVAGAILFTMVSVILAESGARHRKRSQRSDERAKAITIAVGSFIDNVPESIVIGISLIDGEGVALATVIAIFLSNVPEALSSSAGMRRAGMAPRRILLLWGAIGAMGGILSLAGYLVFAGLPLEWTALMQAVAAGALLAMIADTMIPEAFEETHNAAGLVSAAGFVAGFALSHGLG